MQKLSAIISPTHIRRILYQFPRLVMFRCLAVVIMTVVLGGCMSQEFIERACYQTLSASTPVCFCPDNQSTLPPIETEAPHTLQPLTGEYPTEHTSPAQPSGNLIFNADFESGDFSMFEGNDAEFFGKGVYFNHSIVTQPAIGNFAASLSIGSGDTTAAYLFTYRVPSTPLGIYSADFYIPGNVLTSDWWNVWQWKSEDNTYEIPVISLNIISRGTALYAHLFYTPDGVAENGSEHISQSDPIPFPTDRWVNITGYYMSDSADTGYVEIYQDGVMIFDVRNIRTKPGGENILWSVNSYADRIAPDPTTIYVDNISIYESR